MGEQDGVEAVEASTPRGMKIAPTTTSGLLYGYMLLHSR